MLETPAKADAAMELVITGVDDRIGVFALLGGLELGMVGGERT